MQKDVSNNKLGNKKISTNKKINHENSKQQSHHRKTKY